MSTQSNHTGHVIALCTLVIGIPGAVVAWDQLSRDQSDPTATTLPRDVDPPPDPSAAEPPAFEGTGEDDVPAQTDPEPDGNIGQCVIFVDHIGAQIRAEPDHASLALASVPTGEYLALTSTIASWAGRDEKWYQLEVDGRVGWIVSSPILLEPRSPSC